ncbi:MAG: hypothetical protein ACLRFE_04325, partial [Clostridia bacterium]
MFKRILKIVGFVLLGFVILFGGIIGFMAIRGDFKKKEIKPTSVKFAIEGTDLIFDASSKDSPTLANGQILTFTITAEPLDVNVTECTLKLSNPHLLTFMQFIDGSWKEYNGNTFYLNTPIYFKLNDVTDANVDDYYDGVLTITVKDKSGLLQDTIDLVIDRTITSISFKDQAPSTLNNNIINGLFYYEEGQGGGTKAQVLMANENEDYPLEIIAAPLKSLKPFSSEDSKIVEVYYMQDGDQPRLLTHDEEEVIMHRYTDQGELVEDNCDFLKFDEENNCFVFNSAQSGDYSFKLLTYPTYKIQDSILSEAMSFVDRLKSEDVLTKSVVIKVTGTDAEEVRFEGDGEFVTLNLLQDNNLVANNPTMLNVTDLGLVLAKDRTPNITTRYNELKFLKDSDFINNLTWKFKTFTTEGSNVTYGNQDVTIIFSKNALGKFKANVSNLQALIGDVSEFDVALKLDTDKYIMELSNIDDNDSSIYTKLYFTLNVDTQVAGKTLNLNTILTTIGSETLQVVEFETIINTGADQEESSDEYELALMSEGCLVLGEVIDSEEGIYSFKSLKSGIYLAMLGGNKIGLKGLINDEFLTNIHYDGMDTLLTIKPINGEWAEDDKEIKLYAIVINSDGSCVSTDIPLDVKINEAITNIATIGTNLDLPLIINTNSIELKEDAGYNIEDLTWVEQELNYNQVVLFVDESQAHLFKTIDYIAINNYRLVGYMDGNVFVNRLVGADGGNYLVADYDNVKLYPVLVRTRYLKEESRLQTAEEYISELLTGKVGTCDATIQKADGSAIGTCSINYDLSLLSGRRITKQSNTYVLSTNYNAQKQYYIKNNSYEMATPELDEIEAWATQTKYYEKVDCIKISDIFASATAFNDRGLQAYTISGNTLTKVNDSITADNLDNYYILVDDYQVTSVQNDGTNITINASVRFGGASIGEVKFIISANEYQTDVQRKFIISYQKFYNNKPINIKAYYEFDSNITLNFAGTYFEELGYTDVYQIIEGHSELNFAYEGAGDALIKDKNATIGFKIDYNSSSVIYNDILTNNRFSISAFEYNHADQEIGIIVDNDIIRFTNYIKTSDTAVIAGKTYYSYSNGLYSVVDEPKTVDIDSYYEHVVTYVKTSD